MNDVLDQGAPSNQQHLLTTLGISYLRQAYPWIRFLGVVAIIFGVLYILMAFFAGTIFSNSMSEFGAPVAMAGAFMGVFYFISGAIVTYIGFLLYGYGTKLKSGLSISDPGQIDRAFKDQKNYFLVSGILTLIALCFFGFFILIAIVTGFAAG